MDAQAPGQSERAMESRERECAWDVQSAYLLAEAHP